MNNTLTEEVQTVITICMGSSCFSRGNKQVLQIIKEYLAEKDLAAHILFKGSHCMKTCEHGPVVQINGVTHQQVDPSNISDILDKAL